MTTIWLANTASLLLPVSNLTNLLAADRIALAAPAFAARMWAPQLASIAATMLFLWVFYWRRGRRGADRYTPPAADPAAHDPGADALPGHRRGLPALRGRDPVHPRSDRRRRLRRPPPSRWSPSPCSTAPRLRLHLVPWQLLILVTGLFLVVPTLSRYGLADVMTALIGTDRRSGGRLPGGRGGRGAVQPAQQPARLHRGRGGRAAGDEQTLLALLIGTNVGPIVTPWASLATLLCLEACRRHRLRVSMTTFVAHRAGPRRHGARGERGALLVIGG